MYINAKFGESHLILSKSMQGKTVFSIQEAIKLKDALDAKDLFILSADYTEIGLMRKFIFTVIGKDPSDCSQEELEQVLKGNFDPKIAEIPLGSMPKDPSDLKESVEKLLSSLGCELAGSIILFDDLVSSAKYGFAEKVDNGDLVVAEILGQLAKEHNVLIIVTSHLPRIIETDELVEKINTLLEHHDSVTTVEKGLESPSLEFKNKTYVSKN